MAQTNNQESVAAVEENLPVADPAQAQQDLNLAYKKEHAFLTSQVNNIQSRLREYKRNVVEEKRQIETQISTQVLHT